MTDLFTRTGYTQVANVTSPTGKLFFRSQRPCSRCGGAGGSEAWRHTGWTCFQCGGSGHGAIVDAPLYTAEQLARLNAAQAKRDAAKAAVRAAEQAALARIIAADNAAWHAEHADDIELIRGAYAVSPEGSYHRNQLGKAIGYLDAGRSLRYLDDTRALAVEAYDKHALKAASAHFGTIGQRMDVTFVVDFVMTFEPFTYGAGCSYLNVGHTANGNVVVYKGSHGWDKGEEVTAKWTIKAHDYRDGVAQTVLARPTFPKENA
jgi:hypothetical protein